MAIAYVRNHAVTLDTDSASIVLAATFSASVPSGNLLVFSFSTDDTGATLTFCGPGTTTWTKAATVEEAVQGVGAFLYYATLSSSAASTASVTVNKGTTFIRPNTIILNEFSGLPSSPTVVTATNTGTSASAVFNSVSVTSPTALLYTVVADQDGGNLGIRVNGTDSAYTVSASGLSDAAGIQIVGQTAHRTISATGTYTATHALCASATWADIHAAFYGAADHSLAARLQAKNTDWLLQEDNTYGIVLEDGSGYLLLETSASEVIPKLTAALDSVSSGGAAVSMAFSSTASACAEFNLLQAVNAKLNATGSSCAYFTLSQSTPLALSSTGGACAEFNLSKTDNLAVAATASSCAYFDMTLGRLLDLTATGSSCAYFNLSDQKNPAMTATGGACAEFNLFQAVNGAALMGGSAVATFDLTVSSTAATVATSRLLPLLGVGG